MSASDPGQDRPDGSKIKKLILQSIHSRYVETNDDETFKAYMRVWLKSPSWQGNAAVATQAHINRSQQINGEIFRAQKFADDVVMFQDLLKHDLKLLFLQIVSVKSYSIKVSEV